VPLFVHEQNSVIGLTNRILSRLATRSFFAFPEAAAAMPRGECIGNPLRADFSGMPDPAERLEARIGQPLQLLVVGGSLGAAALNRIVPAAVACLDREQRPLIRHQCGERHLEECERNYRDLRVDAEVVRFIEDMREAYAWADLVICRAGALTIAELAAAGAASILVPFPFAVDDHQYHNARYLEQQQAAQIVRETDLDARELALKIQFFQQNRPALVAMAQRARACFRADATERLADGVLAGARS
jgi:UDP-N-acetylglucosamine--N-acetylmuramyl-(pentapeptide) pyrophosphoryl-undecaprenol N-acetylglucosamine transferase